MPVVQRAVAEFFGREPLTNLNPDEGRGARRSHPGQPARREQHRRRPAVAGRDPLSLGIETMGGLVERIVARNETIPPRHRFTTTYKTGDRLAIHVVQGQRSGAGLPQPGALEHAAFRPWLPVPPAFR